MLTYLDYVKLKQLYCEKVNLNLKYRFIIYKWALRKNTQHTHNVLQQTFEQHVFTLQWFFNDFNALYLPSKDGNGTSLNITFRKSNHLYYLFGHIRPIIIKQRV